MNTKSVIFSKFAEDDFIKIMEYYKDIKSDFGKNLFFKIETKINDLKEFPEIGRIIPELEKQNIMEYRELIEGNHRIVYSIQDESIIINTIIDSRRNLEELMIKKLMRFY